MFSFLEGYRAKIGGVGLMLMAVGGAAYAWYQGAPVDLAATLTQFLAGLGIVGIRAKLDPK